MHIILGLLGTIVTILVLLNRLAEAGIDLRWLNPFLWRRRRNWRKQYEGNPLFQIESPMEAAGILLVGVAKADGDICIEEKNLIKELFSSEFKLSEKESAELYSSSAFLIGDGIELRKKVAEFLKPSKEKFSEAQVNSTLKLMQKVASVDGGVQANVNEFMEAVSGLLSPRGASPSQWQ